MRRWLKKIKSSFNQKELHRYLFFTFLFFISIFVYSNMNLTYTKYETKTTINVTPTIAFFIVDVGTTGNSMKLTELSPSITPYLYSFEVSNFDGQKKANVDLKYSISLKTTTNLPLNFKIFKDNMNSANVIDEDIITKDENGMFYRKLIINDISEFSFQTKETDTYILWVEFPEVYKNNPDSYEGVLDLIEIEINAEQVGV